VEKVSKAAYPFRRFQEKRKRGYATMRKSTIGVETKSMATYEDLMEGIREKVQEFI
jgi:hypothetical protein